ncbi:unnamed protein product [Clavelina lepadiformis]|uniref:Uncharacterized protein n=1 Tax=Clavelina lepadiformis TaxID=159417 RepID=A0ABP0GRH7_CLALP
MSPNDTGHSSILPLASHNLQKRSTGRSVAKERRSSCIPARGLSTRSSSPLTPWGEGDLNEANKKRKVSLKGANRMGKSLKDAAKKREKKDGGKVVLPNAKLHRNSANIEENSKPQANFRYHSDIGEYIREYRALRNALLTGHRNCACHGTYGMEEIEKAYDDLGLPRLMHRAQVMAAVRRTTLATVSDNSLQLPATPEEDVMDTGSCNEDSEDEGTGIASPEARQRRKNLNLSPLRKQVRLPDMTKYPVQSISGLGVQELVRLATARGESRLLETRADTSTSKFRYSYTERKPLCPPFHLQEKTMCRVVELSMPDSHLRQSKEEEEMTKKEDKKQAPEQQNNNSGSSQKFKLSKKAKHHINDQSSLENLSEIENRNDDVVTVALGTSRSCQSSVLSNALSSLSERSTSHKHTVREMLTASVRDLHPFSTNGIEEEIDKLAQETVTGNQSDSTDGERTTKDKQIVSLQTYRNLGYKPSMRRYMQELYTPASHTPISAKDSCLISGKPLRKKEMLPEPLPPTFDGKSRLDFDHNKVQQNICATKLLKRVRQRQIAAETYESIKRVVTLQSTRPRGPKLAIFSKCHTVVKPQVSIRGVAL